MIRFSFPQQSLRIRFSEGTAIDHGYFSLRPFKSMSDPNGMTAYMRQVRAASTSEIVIHKESFRYLDGRAFGRALFHELMHAQTVQDTLVQLESPLINAGTTVCNADPKTYYDSINAHEDALQLGGRGAEAAQTVRNYEKGQLFEGNVNNWYSKQVLVDLNLYQRDLYK
jgi:hypothetical protein